VFDAETIIIDLETLSASKPQSTSAGKVLKAAPEK
jgi:hypothetical protein